MRYITRLSAAAGAGCLAAALAGAAATPALADYGTGAQYQVEISANNVGGVPGDGVWLWIELNRNGSGDYTGADCIHTGPAGLNGAGHERGDVTWTVACFVPRGQLLLPACRIARAARRGRRSEERRVGKECTVLCRSRWSPYH